jgi:prepilin-type N-terminal cleavage/methylation domain-containing protein/prepilin-type processing-associated H-X9-DG protein
MTSKRAFTLVELLVVIGIIAVLIGVLLPALSRARGQANLTVCQANLRSIGQIIQMYATAHKGSLPYGFWDGSAPNSTVFDSTRAGEWSTVLLNFLSNKYGTNYTDHASTGGETARLRSAFKDTDTQDGTGIIHYSAHPRLMPNLDDPDWSRTSSASTGPWLQPYRIAKIRRASEIVLIMDGAQVQNNGSATNWWSALATCYKLDANGLYSGTSPRSYMLYDHASARNGEPIDGGPNVDALQNSGADPAAGNLRWRHLRNRTANFLFVDGHVEPRQYKSRMVVELGRVNINVNSP